MSSLHRARDARRTSRSLNRRWHLSILAIKDNGHLFQGVTAGFRVEEISRQPKRDKNRDEDKVVPPADLPKRNRVHKSVEKYCHDGGTPGDGQATRT